MRPDVADALKASSRAFVEVVWPVVGPGIGGGELVPVETVTASGFAKDLDTLAGVDMWQVVRPEGMRPIASRMQLASSTPRLDTFTIRFHLRSGYPTEYHKRVASIRSGYLYPRLTIQAYVTSWQDGALLSAAAIETRALFKWAVGWVSRHGDEPDLWRWREGAQVKDVTGGNQMLVILWDALADVAPESIWQFHAELAA